MEIYSSYRIKPKQPIQPPIQPRKHQQALHILLNLIQVILIHIQIHLFRMWFRLRTSQKLLNRKLTSIGKVKLD